MLQFDLRQLARGTAEINATLPGTDPLFEGLDFVLTEPVRVGGRLQAAGEGRYYWQGTLRTTVAGECRRCLRPVAAQVAADVGVLFTQDPDALDEPGCYPLAPDATQVDLAAAVREELFLAVPRYLECRADCRGLCPRCGQDLNAGPCGCAPAADPRWQALSSLKGKIRD